MDDTKKKYLAYDQEFYAIVHALKKWRHYLFPKEFVLFTYHQALRYMNTLEKVEAMTNEVGRVLVELFICVEAQVREDQQSQ